MPRTTRNERLAATTAALIAAAAIAAALWMRGCNTVTDPTPYVPPQTNTATPATGQQPSATPPKPHKTTKKSSKRRQRPKTTPPRRRSPLDEPVHER